MAFDQVTIKPSQFSYIDRNKVLIGNNGIPANFWYQELDDILEPCEKAASTIGYLITPVLVVNEKVEFFGSVPNQEKLLEILST